MADSSIGLQLFAVRGECSRDLPATLKKVAEIGYVGVEPYGYAGDTLIWQGHDVKEIRAILDDLGLVCCGIHLRTDALLGANLVRTIEYNRILGNRYLIVAADGQRMKTTAGIAELARILNETAGTLSDHNMFTGYHAHGFDAELVEGKPAWFRLFGQVAPEVVMQMDVGNYYSGGGDPLEAMRTFPNRARTVHVKDRNTAEPGAVGTGDAPVREFLYLSRTLHQTEWYVVEECAPEGLGFDVVTRAYSALRELMA